MDSESKFQRKLINELHDTFPECIVLKNDPGYIQGFPDLTIFFGNKWAALEVKKSAHAHHQPNQEYYVSKLNEMSSAFFVYPENKDEVIETLKRYFQTDY